MRVSLVAVSLLPLVGSAGAAFGQDKASFSISSSGAVAWTVNNQTGEVMFCTTRPVPDTTGPEPFCVPANMHPSFPGRPSRSQTPKQP